MTSFLPVADGPNVNSKLYDNVYVSSSNSLTSAARVVTGQAAKISLPSKSFSAQVQVINLPTGMLLGHTQLVLKVASNAIPAGSYLLDNWVHQAVQYYEFVFSDSERLRIDSPQLFIKNMADVESGEKKSTVISLQQTKTSATDTTEIYYLGNLSIYLPFSNLSSSRIHPFPADILERPVQLTIAFNPWINVLQYPAGNAATVQAAIANLNYVDAYVMCKTMYLLDPSDSIRELVSLRGNSKYCYPYMYPQSFVSSAPLVGISPGVMGPTAFMSIPLTRFLNANLQSIDLFLLRLTAGNVAGSGSAIGNDLLSKGSWNQFYFSEMINCRVSYAGQTIWRSDDNSDVLMNISEYPTTTTFKANVPNYATAATGDVALTTQSLTSSWVHVQLSQLNERFYSNLSQVGPTLHTNEVLFEFNVLPRVAQEDFGVTQDLTIQPSYRLYAVYNYSAAVRVAHGQANLVFQPELTVYPSISGVEGTF